MSSISYKLACLYIKNSDQAWDPPSLIGVAPITQITHVCNKNSNIQRRSQCGKSDFPYQKELHLKERICSTLKQVLSIKRSSHYGKECNLENH